MIYLMILSYDILSQDLSENFLRSDGGEALAKVLLKNTSLQKVVLRCEYM